jgi:hypothetical protein
MNPVRKALKELLSVGLPQQIRENQENSEGLPVLMCCKHATPTFYLFMPFLNKKRAGNKYFRLAYF